MQNKKIMIKKIGIEINNLGIKSIGQGQDPHRYLDTFSVKRGIGYVILAII